MHLRLGRAAGVLLLSVVLVGMGGCGGDADDDTGSGLCARADDLTSAREAVPTAQPSSQEDLDEAKARVLEMIDALQALLEAVPEDLQDDAAEVLATTDEIEQRITAAEGADVVIEVPGLLAQISGGDDGPFARVLTEVEETCS